MHRLFGSNRICSGSGSSLAFSIMIVFVLVIAPPARAQGKPDSGSASCVPSDLSSSITQEGRTVQVMQAAEESGRKGNGHASAVVSSSGDAADRLDAEQRKDAYKIFLREAQRGNPAAMVNLGVASLAGWGTEVNAGTALYWLHLAADSGYDPAFYNLGILYFKGCGVPRDAAEAFHFFDLGARSGNARFP